MIESYFDLLHIKKECEQRYEKLLCDYYELKNQILYKENAILKKKFRECEDKLFILEHEFIFS